MLPESVPFQVIPFYTVPAYSRTLFGQATIRGLVVVFTLFA